MSIKYKKNVNLMNWGIKRICELSELICGLGGMSELADPPYYLPDSLTLESATGGQVGDFVNW